MRKIEYFNEYKNKRAVKGACKKVVTNDHNSKKLTKAQFRIFISALALTIAMGSLTACGDNGEGGEATVPTTDEIATNLNANGENEFIYDRLYDEYGEFRMVIKENGNKYQLTVYMGDKEINSYRGVYNKATQTFFSDEDMLTIPKVELVDNAELVIMDADRDNDENITVPNTDNIVMMEVGREVKFSEVTDSDYEKHGIDAESVDKDDIVFKVSYPDLDANGNVIESEVATKDYKVPCYTKAEVNGDVLEIKRTGNVFEATFEDARGITDTYYFFYEPETGVVTVDKPFYIYEDALDDDGTYTVVVGKVGSSSNGEVNRIISNKSSVNKNSSEEDKEDEEDERKMRAVERFGYKDLLADTVDSIEDLDEKERKKVEDGINVLADAGIITVETLDSVDAVNAGLDALMAGHTVCNLEIEGENDWGESATEEPSSETTSTENPSTETPPVPNTQNPSTEAHSPEKPSTESPTTAKPSTETPTTQAPTTVRPTTEASTTQAPTTQSPTTQAPTTSKPTTEATTEDHRTPCEKNGHSWVVVDLSSEGHWETKIVKDAWDEKVKVGSHYQCNNCGANLGEDMQHVSAHSSQCGSYSLVSDYEYVHHEAEYGEVWVPHYAPGSVKFVCSVCGKEEY